MAKITFDGFDKMAQELENVGKLDKSHIGKVCKAGADVVLKSLKGDGRFGKYAKAKKMTSGNYSLYYDGTTGSGYSAFGAAKVYEDGRKAKERGSKKAKTSEQRSRPFFKQLIDAATADAVKAMQAALDKILEAQG